MGCCVAATSAVESVPVSLISCPLDGTDVQCPVQESILLGYVLDGRLPLAQQASGPGKTLFA
jgi:hypothetical protein